MKKYDIDSSIFKPGTSFFNQTIGYSETKYHNHSLFEFFYVVSGSCEHVLNGKTHTLRANDFLLLRHKDYHMFLDKHTNDFLHTDIIISDSIVEKAKLFLNDSTIDNYFEMEHPYIIRISSIELSLIENRIISINEAKDEKKNSLVISLTIFLLSIIAQSSLPKSGSNKPLWLKQLLSLLEYNDSLLKSREELYKLYDTLSYNRSYLNTAFKKEMGITISEYINNLRMSTAYSLLLNTNLPIEKIMQDVGINNRTFFYKKFENKYHITPYKLRKEG